MHVAVMGAGSLGSLLGGVLSRTHEVTLVGRKDRMAAIAADGLQLDGAMSGTVHPAVTTDWSGVESPDVALLTVKTYDVDTAVDAMQQAPPPIVLSLQNGLGSAEHVADRLPKSTVLVGTVTYGALSTAPGVVKCTGRGEIVFGRPDGGRAPAADRLEAAFDSAGLSVQISEEMPRHRWRKVAVNAAINPLTALVDRRNRAITVPPLDGIADAIAREVAQVAQENGVDLTERTAIDAVRGVAAATADNLSSMARDHRRGARTERAAITGAVLDRAGTTPVPHIRTVDALLAAAETNTDDGKSG